MIDSRRQVCERTSRKLAASLISSIPATIGFDGFVDEIIDVVETRHDDQKYDRVRTIEAFRDKLAGAIGHSCNYELVARKTQAGGNAPNMANALARMGASVTCIGNLGLPQLHPVFEDFAKRAEVISIGQPCHTDALEFDDGKLMLGKVTPLHDITWDNLLKFVGRARLQKLMTESHLIGLANWTMLPHVNEIWIKLRDEMIRRDPNRPQTLFVDLADPEKRSAADLREALELLATFQDRIDVILGLNLKESTRVAQVLGLDRSDDQQAAAKEIQRKLKLTGVVIHPRHGASAAMAGGNSAAFTGPFVNNPTISTGGGDHFNAGFALAHVLGFDLQECLCMAVAASGHYVRTGRTADAPALVDFIANLPAPENP